MNEIKFRWPEDNTQYVEPKDIRSHKSDDYLDRLPASPLLPWRGR